jgi:hypothetical protein
MVARRQAPDRDEMANVLTRICLMVGCGYDDRSILQRLEIDCAIRLGPEDLIAIKHALGFSKDRAVVFLACVDRLNMDLGDLVAMVQAGDIWRSIDLGRKLHEVCPSDKIISFAEVDGIPGDAKIRHTAAIRLGFRMARDIAINRPLSMSLYRHGQLMKQAGVDPNAVISFMGIASVSPVAVPAKAAKPLLTLKRGQKLT